MQNYKNKTLFLFSLWEEKIYLNHKFVWWWYIARAKVTTFFRIWRYPNFVVSKRYVANYRIKSRFEKWTNQYLYWIPLFCVFRIPLIFIYIIFHRKLFSIRFLTNIEMKCEWGFISVACYKENVLKKNLLLCFGTNLGIC